MSSEKSSTPRSPWSQASPDSLPGSTLSAQTQFRAHANVLRQLMVSAGLLKCLAYSLLHATF